MLLPALLAAAALAAGLSIPPEAWAEPEQSLATVRGFRVRVDVHGGGDLASILGQRLRQQIVRALQIKNVPVAEAPEDAPPALDGVGVIVLDVHLSDAGEETAVAWSLHASQVVHLRDGAFAFASTWEVGDLLRAPTAATAVALRASLQPALEELCELYRDAHPRVPPPARPRPPAQPPQPAPAPDGLAV